MNNEIYDVNDSWGLGIDLVRILKRARKGGLTERDLQDVIDDALVEAGYHDDHEE